MENGRATKMVFFGMSPIDFSLYGWIDGCCVLFYLASYPSIFFLYTLRCCELNTNFIFLYTLRFVTDLLYKFKDCSSYAV